MDVVYFFCGPAVVRIPYINYDQRFFDLLSAQGGTWDKAGNQILFRRDRSAQFVRIFKDAPLVWVDENTSAPPKITGFLERPWNRSTLLETAKTVQPVASKMPDKLITSLPEKFPDYWRVKLEEEMRTRKYSPSTIGTYIYFNRMLCRTMQKTPEEMRMEDIPVFLATVEKNRDYSAASINLAISSFKFFYKRVLKNDIVSERKRPRQDKRLPVVLSKGEVDDIITVEKNIKHRLLLMIVYGSGLRVGEVVRLKRRDVDTRRKTLTIISGKGRKDRQTVLPDAVISLLDIYKKKHDVSEWLFPSYDPTRHLSIRSAQHICEHALEKANIEKDASIHNLRHSFATHLLESGTDIRYIQEFLGHTSIRTTERYTHVARYKVAKIKSPLDTLDERD